jgi:SAM-dependent methyltransferase
MHEGAYRFVAGMVAWMEPRRAVIELGARTVAGDWPYSGAVRPLFNSAWYVGVDIAPGPNVDVIADAAHWRGKHDADTVVCCETLEHTPEAARICENASRLLANNGVFIVTAAGAGRAPHSAVDGGRVRVGEFYRNVSREQLRDWLQPFFGFWMIDTDTPGDIYAMAVK